MFSYIWREFYLKQILNYLSVNNFRKFFLFNILTIVTFKRRYNCAYFVPLCGKNNARSMCRKKIRSLAEVAAATAATARSASTKKSGEDKKQDEKLNTGKKNPDGTGQTQRRPQRGWAPEVVGGEVQLWGVKATTWTENESVWSWLCVCVCVSSGHCWGHSHTHIKAGKKFFLCASLNFDFFSFGPLPSKSSKLQARSRSFTQHKNTKKKRNSVCKKEWKKKSEKMQAKCFRQREGKWEREREIGTVSECGWCWATPLTDVHLIPRLCLVVVRVSVRFSCSHSWPKIKVKERGGRRSAHREKLESEIKSTLSYSVKN